MADLFKRKVNGVEVWYAWLHYSEDGRTKSIRKSTGVRVGGSAEREAADAIARKHELAIAHGGVDSARPSKTLSQALNALWNDKVLAERASGTMEIYRQKGAKLIEHFDRNRALNTIDADALKEYAKQARKLRKKATVSRELLVLSQAFGAVGMECPKMPDLGEPDPSRDRVIELVEQRRVLAVLSPERRYCFTALLQLGGIRKDEYNKVEQIDWDGRFAFINGTKTKNSKRWVAIPDELFELILPYKDNWQGLPKWTNIDRDLRLAAKRADIPVFSCNDCRRTYATLLARSGVDPLRLSKLMGTSVKMLSGVYARLEKVGEHMHSAIAGLPTLIPSARKKRPITAAKEA